MPAEDPDQLREGLVDTLQRYGALHSNAIANAMRTLPRHAFAPWLPVHLAYADQAFPVPTARGDKLSSISQPSTVALMLEALDLEPGHHVLEIGTGTGYNAALLATLVGPEGHVTTIDIERLGHNSLYDPRHHLVVTDEDDQAVAACIYWTEPTTRIGLIEPVATHPAHRRRGLAKAMLTHALQDMRHQGTAIAKVCQASSNLPAATLYHALGFRPRSELLRYTR